MKTLQYQEEIALHLIGDEQLDENCQLKTVFLSAPTCQKVDMQPDHTISMTIEKKLRTSVIKGSGPDGGHASKGRSGPGNQRELFRKFIGIVSNNQRFSKNSKRKALSFFCRMCYNVEVRGSDAMKPNIHQ